MTHTLTFFKSSHSGQDVNCIEVAHVPSGFRKSSYSGVNGDCVEVAELPAGAAVRDSKHPERGHLDFPTTEWTAFLASAQRGEL